MSMNTIVIVVLAVTALILGVVLVQKIFSSAKGAVDMTDQALTKEINKLFSEEKKVVIFPSTQSIELKVEGAGDIGIGIKNLLIGSTGAEVFSYKVAVSDPGVCRETPEQILKWVELGSQGNSILIASGDTYLGRVSFRIPPGNSLCKARFAINVFVDNVPYQASMFDVSIIG